MNKTILTACFFLYSHLLCARPNLINGLPAGNMFPSVGMINNQCTITKIGPRQFITAAHCISRPMKTFGFTNFQNSVTLKVKSGFSHPSWIKDCTAKRCDGTEVGSSRMTPGRSDVYFITVENDSPTIAITQINFKAIDIGTEVAMVGAGCTRQVEPGGRAKMRYGITKLVSADHLNHTHSLYKDIAEISGKSNWVTVGYRFDKSAMSLCPGDSGGPLMTKNTQGIWEIIGIAADYTFDGKYRDGDESVTNLHTRLDDQSLSNVGAWIRSNWDQ